MLKSKEQAELLELRETLLDTSDKVIENLFYSINSGKHKKSIKALKRMERVIMHIENRIEERCMSLMMRENPDANDLSNVIFIMRINEDLALINELTLNVLEKMTQIRPELFDLLEFKAIAIYTLRMFKAASDSYVKREKAFIENVFSLEEEIRQMLQNVFGSVASLMKTNSVDSEQLFSTLYLARQIGRICEHILNITQAVNSLESSEYFVRNNRYYCCLFDLTNPNEN